MEGKKPWYASKTIIGLAVMLIGILVKHFALPISESELLPVVTYLFEAIGAIMVFVGRITAKKQIG